MPDELGVQPIAHAQLAAGAVGQVGAAASIGGAANSATQAAQPQKTEPAPNTEQVAQLLYANPVSELDPALGIVVLHFYNAQGVQTQSIPSQKQLDSYRLHDQAGATSAASAQQYGPPSATAAPSGDTAGSRSSAAPPSGTGGPAAAHIDETGN